MGGGPQGSRLPPGAQIAQTKRALQICPEAHGAPHACRELRAPSVALATLGIALLRGRTRRNTTVNFAGSAVAGDLVDVRIEEATSTTLRGRQAVPVAA